MSLDFTLFFIQNTEGMKYDFCISFLGNNYIKMEVKINE